MNFNKMVICHDGLSERIISLKNIIQELRIISQFNGVYSKFKYKGIKYFIEFVHTNSVHSFILAHINININMRCIKFLENLNINKNNIVYLNNKWLGISFNNGEKLMSIYETMYVDTNLNQKTFKLPSYLRKKCMEIITMHHYSGNF